MVTIESVFITAAVVFTFVFILNIALLFNLRKSLSQTNSRKIRITAILCLLTSAMLSFLFVLYNILKYISLTHLNKNPFQLKSITNLVLFVRVITGVLNFIFVAYFITIKLEDAFKDTFLSIKKRTIYICFAIYAVIMCINWWGMFYLVFVFSHWYPKLALEPYQTLLAITNGAYSFTSEIYFILILVIFNWKLFKFVRLTMNNNEVLSLEINNRFKNFIIKQTNLISIITIAFCIFQGIAYWKWVESPKDNLVNLLYPILFTLQQSIWAICIYLTFKFNNKYYYICCKYSHLCCIYSCTNLINKSDTYSSVAMTIQQHQQSQSSTNELECIEVICNIDQCKSFEMIRNALNEYNNKFIPNEKELLNKYDINDILNAFNHLLQKHDSSKDFAAIYDKLNSENGSFCEYMRCDIYSRHYSRRIRDANNKQTMKINMETYEVKELESDNEIQYTLANIFDKLHSFYYHSYDTFTRIKMTDRIFANKDDRISEIHKMVKLRRDRGNRTELLTNKFNSDLLKNIKDNNIQNDIYSFGERFEYFEESHKLYVKPKYSNMKSEFIDNKMCSIPMDIYEMEYNKSKQYMNTKHVKILMNKNKNNGTLIQFSLEYILVLMIYCNCDKFQAKWSETFRQIPYNESDESLKQRHSYFYYCSKNLRDLIEYFGSRLIDNCNENKTFYHGVNQILYLTRTITKFNAPLSTSTEATVALNFSGDIGVVLELKYSSSTYLLHAKYFDCAFFSDFISEKECLFVGGIPMLIITNIINVSNGKMYRKYINALNILNCVLNGTFETDNILNYDFNNESIELCAQLITHQLEMYENNEKNDGTFPQYIINLLNRYCMNLNNIMVFWNHMSNVNQLKKTLCNDMNDGLFFDVNILLKLFPNIQQIEYRFIKDNQLKSIIKQLMNHVSECILDINHKLKYIIIHHKHISIPNYENNGWKSFQDQKKIVLYNYNLITKEEIDFNSLNLKYNQIKQSNASKNMIKNLL